jgi:hypothetical protein
MSHSRSDSFLVDSPKTITVRYKNGASYLRGEKTAEISRQPLVDSKPGSNLSFAKPPGATVSIR